MLFGNNSDTSRNSSKLIDRYGKEWVVK